MLIHTFNPLTGVEIQAIGHFKLLFALLRIDGCSKMQQLALEVISTVTGNQECVNDIAASEVLAYLLLVIQTLPNCEWHTPCLKCTLYRLNYLKGELWGKYIG